MRNGSLALILVVGLTAGLTVGCGGRSLGGDNLSDGALGSADAEIGELDAGQGEADAGLIVPEICEAQEVWDCPDDCVDVVGYFWDGAFCAPIVCCCEGPDCEETYATQADCVADRGRCWEEVCTDTGGYCASGSGPEASCAVGHYPNSVLAGANPGLCGGGVCCTPCPEPDYVQVDYIGNSPEDCAAIDWDCFSPGWVSFQNECGCGCALLE